MKLAIVSSYAEACGAAACATAIEQACREKFEVQMFNLQTASLIANEMLHNSAAAEAHIDQICEALKDFDCVNIQLEWGLYGREIDIMRRRLIKLVKASRCLILTIHSLHINEATQPMHRAVFQTLKDRDNSQPYWFIAHLPREADTLRNVYGLENVTDFPVVFLSQQDVKNYHARAAKAAEWKVRNGFQKDDIVILRAGFLVPHKDHMVSLKSLRLLPSNYKLAFTGGEHPPGIQKNTISPVVQEITNYLDHCDEQVLLERARTGDNTLKTLGDRVRFLGSPSDDELYLAMSCSDFVTITHLESGQSSSGIASIALQLERPIILSYNRFFLEYEKYYKDGFSFFTMGNHYELRDKILNFDYGCVDKLKEYGQKYSLDSLAELYQKLYDDMKNGRVNNAGRRMPPTVVNIAFAPSAAPPPSPSTSKDIAARKEEVNQVIYNVLWRLIHFARRVRNNLRRKRQKFNVFKKTVLKPLS